MQHAVRKQISRFWVLGLCALAPSGIPGWAGDAACATEPVQFRDGGRSWNYQRFALEGWMVYVHVDLLPETALLQDLRGQLRVGLRHIAEALPEEALPALRRIPIWVSDEPDYPMRPNEQGVIVYHTDPGWLRPHGLNPHMVPGVHVVNPRAVLYTHRVFEWGPMTMLHELTHAYHDTVLGWDDAELRATYRAALQRGLYREVPHRSQAGLREPAYAASNEQEYFAELSEAYFGRNDYFPHNRAELRAYDPAGCALVARLWKGPGALRPSGSTGP